MKYEVNHNDIGMGHFWLNGWGIYDLTGVHLWLKWGAHLRQIK